MPPMVYGTSQSPMTSTTPNTFVLQTFSNINPCRTHLNTQGAIYAIPQVICLGINLVRTPTSGFTAFFIVGHDQRVMVKHRALKACIGTHVFTDLFTHKSSIAVGSKRIEKHPKQFPTTHSGVEKLHAQITNGGEVPDKGKACPNREADP